MKDKPRKVRKDLDRAIENDIDGGYTFSDDEGFIELACYAIPIKRESLVIYRDNSHWVTEEARHFENKNKIAVSQYKIPIEKDYEKLEIDEDMKDREKYIENLPEDFIENSTENNEKEVCIDLDLFDPRKAIENLPSDFLSEDKTQENEREEIKLKRKYRNEDRLRGDVYSAMRKKDQPDDFFGEYRDESFFIG